MVELWTTKVYEEVGQSMLQRKQLLAKVLLGFVSRLHLISALREADKSVERFALHVDEVCDELHRFKRTTIV